MKFCILPRAIIISSAKESHFLHWDTDQRRRLEFHTHDNDFIRISHSIQGITYIFQLAEKKIQFQLRLWENHHMRSRKYIPEIFTSPFRRQSAVTANEIPIFVCAKRALQTTPKIWICSNWRSSHLWRLLMIHISTIFASEPSIYSLWRRMRR